MNSSPTADSTPTLSGHHKLNNVKNNSNRGRGGRRGRGKLSARPAPSPSPSIVVCIAPSESPDNAKTPHIMRQRTETRSRRNRPHSPKLANSPVVNVQPRSDASDLPNSPKPASDAKSNIDALVERVRASAMANNRPNTPKSHIDWAGDDDHSLPDLEDWGIKTPTPLTGQVMISPIIVDGLTPLPDPAAALLLTEKQGERLVQESTSEPDPLSQPLADQRSDGHGLYFIKEQENGKVIFSPSAEAPESVVRASPVHNMHSSLQPKPASPVHRTGKYRGDVYSSASKKYIKHGVTASNSSTSRSDSQTPDGNLSAVINETAKGLAASIHAPEGQKADNAGQPDSAKLSSQVAGVERRKSMTSHRICNASKGHDNTHPFDHGRARIRERFSYSNRAPRTEPLTVNRTSASLSTSNHNRSSHSRPVLTGDALSKLAKTIGGTSGSPTKNLPISTPLD